ncbi:hypothetical protein [uncultured Metabacillus sp.]|uniref:hypothetical protein n=1 Tax=uncultured Metabacillus sp. TaxID=2860135 RepID=UPI00260CEFD7|nr:hypothetical protein [uncultured Metabacillus sp.]
MTTWRELTSETIKSSDYMSDSLCHAIIIYEALVKLNAGRFSSLLSKLKKELATLTTKTNELFNLDTELKATQDQIDVLKAAEMDYSDLSVKLNVKQIEVNKKQSEVDKVQSEIDLINANISALKNLLSIENNFTPEQIQERNNYIIEKTWSDDNYSEVQELYDDAKVKFDEIRKPKINIDVSSVNFFKMIEEQRNWNRLYLGDVVTVRHPMINVNYEVFVTDMTITDDSLELTIADFEEVRKDEKLIEMLKASYSSSTTVDMNKYKWNQTVTDLGEVNDIINNTWDAAKRRITAGVNESVEISNRGIIIRNPNFPNEIIVIQSGVIALSEDNGTTWKTAITPKGVFAQRLVGQIIAGVNLSIINESGKFTFDKDGAVIEGASFSIVGGQNGIELDPETGLTINRSDNKTKIILNATDGFKIQKYDTSTSTWKDTVSIDTDGNPYFAGKLKSTNSDSSIVIEDDSLVAYYGVYQTSGRQLLSINDTVPTMFDGNQTSPRVEGYGKIYSQRIQVYIPAATYSTGDYIESTVNLKNFADVAIQQVSIIQCQSIVKEFYAYERKDSRVFTGGDLKSFVLRLSPYYGYTSPGFYADVDILIVGWR